MAETLNSDFRGFYGVEIAKSPAFQAYLNSERGELHPLGGGAVDEMIAAREAGLPIYAETIAALAAKDFAATLEKWRNQATEELATAEKAIAGQEQGGTI